MPLQITQTCPKVGACSWTLGSEVRILWRMRAPAICLSVEPCSRTLQPVSAAMLRASCFEARSILSSLYGLGIWSHGFGVGGLGFNSGFWVHIEGGVGTLVFEACTPQPEREITSVTHLYMTRSHFIIFYR